jgi:hypothetical protein
LAKCKLNLTTSPTLLRALHELKKTYPHIEDDLEQLKTLVESDYQKAANADRLKMPGHPDLAGKVWKYDCRSSDINKHQRESARLVCMFLDDPGTLYGVLCFVRANNPYVDPREMERCMKQLSEALSRPAELPVEVCTDCKVCGSALTGDEQDAFGDRCAQHRTATI